MKNVQYRVHLEIKVTVVILVHLDLWVHQDYQVISIITSTSVIIGWILASFRLTAFKPKIEEKKFIGFVYMCWWEWKWRSRNGCWIAKHEKMFHEKTTWIFVTENKTWKAWINFLPTFSVTKIHVASGGFFFHVSLFNNRFRIANFIRIDTLSIWTSC